MKIKFNRPANPLDPRCFCRAGQPAGLKLQSDLVRPGRPETIRSILLVDDDGMILTTFVRSFKRLNIPGLEISRVDPNRPIREQVLALAPRHDLVLMDGQMPFTSGEALVRELRESGYQGYIAANSGDPGNMRRMMEAGADFQVINKDAFRLRECFQRS